MQTAIDAARSSFAAGDYAVGSAIYKGDELLSSSGNRTHLENDATQHAEMIAIRDVSQKLKSKDLSGCVLYATHEPCPMCMGAIIWSRIPMVVYGATMEDHKRHRDRKGNANWRWRVVDVPARYIADRGEPLVELIPGFMREECLALFHS